MKLTIPAAPKLSAVMKESVPKITLPKAGHAPKPFMPRNRGYKPAPNKKLF